MKKPVAALLVFALLTNISSAADYLSNANYFGIITTENQDGKTGCASVDSTAVTIGMPVNVVVLSTPQRMLTGIVKSKSDAGCTRYFQSSESSAFYEIQITQGRFEPNELGVLVLPPLTITQTKKDGVMTRIGQENFRFYECSSNEGIHIMVRSAAGHSLPLWHDYIYLGYDVEPTCTKKVYDGIAELQKNVDASKRSQGK